MDKKSPIGVFDSGYGGLTILSALRSSLPTYDFLYLGDNARAPYGTRSFDVVYEYTLEAVKTLFEQGCELVILACNTASAKALRTIQQHDLPHIDPKKRVLGVIRPSVEMLANLSNTHEIGVLATEGTVKSESYVLEIQKLAPEVRVFQQACPIWVPLIEHNLHQSDAGKSFIASDWKALIEQSPSIDSVILGCTHYPLVADFLRSISEGIRIIEQGPIVAASLVDYLKRHPEMEAKCSKGASVEYLTSENVQTFNEKASFFLGEAVQAKHIHF